MGKRARGSVLPGNHACGWITQRQSRSHTPLHFMSWVMDLDASSIPIKLHLPSAGHGGQKSSCGPKAPDTQDRGWTCRDAVVGLHGQPSAHLTVRT